MSYKRVSDTCRIGKNVRISSTATIHDNVTIGDNSIIGPYCSIGEPQNDAYHLDNYDNPPTIIGESTHLRSHSIIYSGNQIGNHFHLGHFSIIRPNCSIGNYSSVGNRSELHGGTVIGNYSRLHSNVDIAYATIGDYVWIFTGAKFTSDPNPPSPVAIGPTIGDYSIIAVEVTILSQVSVGAHCLIGACSLVNKHIPDYSFAFGSPAKVYKDVRDADYTPWPNKYSKGFPWSDIGFDLWNK